MNPLPARLHAPSGITTYTDSADWRAQISYGNIPRDTNSLSRFWTDTSAVQRLSQIERLKSLIPGFSAPTSTREYTVIARNASLNLDRVPIGSQQFYTLYTPTMAHKDAVQTMVQYKWVFEMQGMPPFLDTISFSEAEAASPNFIGKDPRYPLELRPDHIYFPMGEELFALPVRDFIQRFQPAVNSLKDMRAAVLTLASDLDLTDEQAISMIRLAVIEKPKTPPVI
jgi:hypothetical protein